MKLTAWHKTTGIKANRVFNYSEDPEMKKEETHEAWLEARRKGIGGSDISAIAGVNPFKSAIDVFLEKTGRLRVPENKKMRWGKILEDPVAKEYGVTEGVRVQRINAMLQHPTHEFALVNLDRLIVKNGAGLDKNRGPVHQHLLALGNGSLEVKTTGWAKAWEGDEIPDMYYTQLQWQLGITSLQWGQFAVLVSGQDFVKPRICRLNPEIFKNLLRLGKRFWTENVLKDRAPDPDDNPRTLDSMKLLYPDIEENTIMLDNNLNKVIERRGELERTIKTAKGQKAAIDSQVLAQLQNAKWGLTDQFKVTRVRRSSLRFNSKKFQKGYPDLHKKFCVASEAIYPMYKELKTSNKHKEEF